MTPLRTVLITRRFWPLAGGGERVMATLAEALIARSHSVNLLTARWEPFWTEEFNFRDIPVTRIAQPRGRTWGTWRYMAGISRWLKAHAHEIDLVYVSMLKHDAYAALGACHSTRIPVVLRAEGGGATGDCAWQNTARFGAAIRRRCQSAAAIVVPSRPIADELIAAGYDSSRLHVIPNGVFVPEVPDAAQRQASRAALAEIHAHLRVPQNSFVAVYSGRLVVEKGLPELLLAWRMVVARRPDARLWLFGEGPLRTELEHRVREFGLEGRIVLPGVFDSLDDILAAANLFLLPSHEEGLSLALLEAMAIGLPCIASDIPGNRAVLVNQQNGLLVPVRDVEAIAAAALRLIAQPALAAALGGAARRSVETHWSLDQCVERHLNLFQEMCRGKAR